VGFQVCQLAGGDHGTAVGGAIGSHPDGLPSAPTPAPRPLPQNVGNLGAGTLLLSTVVSGEDVYYTEQKAANANWVPTNDGDRRDMAIVLYSSTDQGASWTSSTPSPRVAGRAVAPAPSASVARANTYRQVDPCGSRT
jgi:hypothetical protein